MESPEPAQDDPAAGVIPRHEGVRRYIFNSFLRRFFGG